MLKITNIKEEINTILKQIKKTEFENLEIVKFLITELEYHTKSIIIDEDIKQPRPKSGMVKSNSRTKSLNLKNK